MPEPLPAAHECVQSTCDGFVALLERIRSDWRHFLGAEPESWTYLPRAKTTVLAPPRSGPYIGTQGLASGCYHFVTRSNK